MNTDAESQPRPVDALRRGLLWAKTFRLKTTPLRYSLAMALFFLVALNYPFDESLFASMGGLRVSSLGDALMVFAGIYVVLFLLFFVFTAWKRVTKPIAYLLLLTAAPASLAVLYLNVEFTPITVRAVFTTDPLEVKDFFTASTTSQLLLLGVLPCLLLSRVDLEFPPLKRLATQKALSIGACLVVAAALYLPNQLFFNSFVDNATNYRLKTMLVPFNYLDALLGFLKEEMPRTAHASGGGAPRVHVEATRGPRLAASGKRTILIFVLGESARARSFSLNGYDRDTNPRLEKEDVVSFTRFHSCATATAIAVPCLFSGLGEQDFSLARASASDNLLDVAQRAGFQVTWYENGMGTLSVDRNETEVRLGSYYKAERDHVLVDRLPSKDELDRSGKDQFIVLHQRGSHGPDYSERYPPEFRTFTPDCDSVTLKSCSREEIVNAYDNTILYTDAVLADAIEYLKGLEGEYNGALVYLSDHGESTGEGGWYMHGLPMSIAPDDQTRVPFIAWFSPGIVQAEKLDVGCVKGLRDAPFSQDDVFATTLGLLDVVTPVYDGARDIFRPCRGADDQTRPPPSTPLVKDATIPR